MTDLLPDHLAATRRPGLDATSLLTVYVVLLIAIPSKLVFAPLGGAGTPAQVVGLAALIWYVWFRIQRPMGAVRSRQPVVTAMALFVAAILCSYISAMIRPIAKSEVSTADLGLVAVAGWVGIMLLANDGIPSLDRLFRLLRRLSTMGGALATFGIIQFATGRAFVDLVSIPGLTENQSIPGLNSRDGFSRPAGTAIHPIEFGVVITVILPIALACAMAMKDRSLLRRWYAPVAIGIAIPLSISRTAIVGTVVVLAFMLPTWPKVARRATLLAIGTIVTVMFVVLPGFLGTIAGLFTGIGTDTSAASRTNAYAIAGEFIEKTPVFGRGFSTFLPTYWILDNQYLLLMVEAGFVGLAAILWLFGSAIRVGRKACRHAGDDLVVRQVGQALAASVACGAVATALYDLLSFSMSSGILFLVIGLSGALWRLARLELPARPVAPASLAPPS